MGLYRITVIRPYRTTELMLEAGMSVEVASTVNPIQSTNLEMKKVVPRVQ